MTVCFIGHRAVEKIELVRMRLTETIATLIADGADTFLFGSKSDFNTLCWDTVTQQQKQYPYITRIRYNAPRETAFTSKEECQRYEQAISRLAGKEVNFQDYEKAVNSQKATNSTKDTYVMRNYDMIDDSDVCVFYYNKDYLPPRRKQAKRHVFDYQPQSGAAVAFAYAKRKKKKIINLYD